MVDLPPSFALDGMPPVEDQAGMPFCAVYTVLAGLAYYHKMDTGHDVDFSEVWANREARRYVKYKKDWGGVNIGFILRLARNRGMLPRQAYRDVWMGRLKGKELEKLLANYKIREYHQVNPRDEQAVRAALLKGPLFASLRIDRMEWRDAWPTATPATSRRSRRRCSRGRQYCRYGHCDRRPRRSHHRLHSGPTHHSQFVGNIVGQGRVRYDPLELP